MTDPTYRLYGLNVRTDLPLAPAPLTTASPDIIVTRTSLGVRPASPSSPLSVFWERHPRGACLSYATTSGHRLEFEYTGKAARVEIRSTQPDDESGIAAVFIGPAMAAALHLRGFPILHGAAVVVDGRALVLLGASGAGKSTLTAALVAAGAALLTEDVAAIDQDGPFPGVRPGYPRLGLHAASLKALGVSAMLPRVLPSRLDDDKRWLDAVSQAGGFHAAAAPLGAIYVLRPRTRGAVAATVTPLSAPRAALTLAEFQYGRTWLVHDPRRVLADCAFLASRVPVCEVMAPDGLDRLGESVRSVLSHMNG